MKVMHLPALDLAAVPVGAVLTYLWAKDNMVRVQIEKWKMNEQVGLAFCKIV